MPEHNHTSPIEITNALAALDAMHATTPQDDFSVLAKALPPLARRLAQHNQDISIAALINHAQAGVDHVRDLYASLNAAQKQKPQKSYDEIIESFESASSQNNVNAQTFAPSTAKDDPLIAGTILEISIELAPFLDRKNTPKSALLCPSRLLNAAVDANKIDAFRAIMALQTNPTDLYEAVERAARKNHSEMLQILFNEYHSNEYLIALKTAAQNDHADLLRVVFDLMKAANRTIMPELVLNETTKSKTLNTFRMLINDYGMNDPNRFRNLLPQAAEHGNTPLIRALIEEFHADINANDDDGRSALQIALWHEHLETACVLIDEYGADDSDLDTSDKHKLDQTRIWLNTHGFSHHDLCTMNPALIKRTTLLDVRDMIEKETGPSHVSWGYIYNTSAVFGTTDRVLRYFEQWGEWGQQPLHDIVQMIKIPTQDQIDRHQKPDLKAWGDALLQCGPKMGHLVKFSYLLPTPEKDASGRFWSYDRTIKSLSAHTDFIQKFSPDLTEIGLRAFWDQEDFEIAEETITAYHALYTDQGGQKSVNAIPAITIPGHHFGKDGCTFRRLPDGDVRGLALGAFTACCQHVGGEGRACAIDGFLSSTSGFYVITNDKTDQIVAQSWAWRGKDNELVLDSLEYLPSHMDSTQWTTLCNLFAQKAKDAGVDTIHLGKGGNTPRHLSFKTATSPATPRDYSGYRDSEAQYVIAAPKP